MGRRRRSLRSEVTDSTVPNLCQRWYAHCFCLFLNTRFRVQTGMKTNQAWARWQSAGIDLATHTALQKGRLSGHYISTCMFKCIERYLLKKTFSQCTVDISCRVVLEEHSGTS
jgi:hypothetical protein